ncbi:MAG: hypothetical protein PHP69_01105 [Candidatus Omnitrophica bacterium]|jgi:zona occludens toxin (predicted ATPase)|nr:hypothetical protein [Candidatus Omnitrophota bacterium]MDD5081183.1 hypothetical protein [Candidatus Omnitrophota bacterium]MDD5440621.1 hypothetical protein [Candidatus Omnitrophota bacterium]
MKVLKKITGIQKDYISTFLRDQISDLEIVLSQIESSENFEDEYVEESLKRVKRRFYQFRFFYN